MNESNLSNIDLEKLEDNNHYTNTSAIGKSNLSLSRNLNNIFNDPVQKEYYLYLEEQKKKLIVVIDEVLEITQLYSLQCSELSSEINSLKIIKSDLEKEIIAIKFERQNLNITKDELEELMDRSPLKIISNIFNSKDFLFSEFGKKIDKLDVDAKDDAKKILNGKTGRYMKTVGSVICFLKKLVEFYQEKSLSRPMGQIKGNKNSTELDNKIISHLQKNALEMSIEVIYLEKRVNFTIGNELKIGFTFHNLKIKCCEYWNIPEQSAFNYHIMNLGEIFNGQDKVYEIIRQAEESQVKLSFEMIDKKIILENINKLKQQDNKQLDEFKNIEKLKENSQGNSVEKEKAFLNDIDYYEREASIWELTKEFFFGNKQFKERLAEEENKFENEFKKILEKRRKKESNDGYEETPEEKKEREREERQEKREMHKERIDNFKQRFYKKRKLEPLIITTYDIFLFRFKSFANFILYIMFLYYFFKDSRIGNSSTDYLTEASNRINSILFENSNYKNFLRKSKLKDLQPNDLISDKRDLINYIRFILNNLISRKNDDPTLSIGNFQSLTDTGFTLLNPIKMTFKLTDFQVNNSTYSVSSKLFDEKYPVSPEFTTYTEFNSKIKTNYSLYAQNFPELINKTNKIIPNYDEDEQTGIGEIKFNLSTKPYIMSGVVASYLTEGFEMCINFDEIDKIAYDSLIAKVTKDIIYLELTSFIKISLNFYSPSSNILIKVDILVEFSSVGYLSVILHTGSIDISISKDFASNIFSFSNVYSVFFFLSHIWKYLFMKFMEKRDADIPDLIDRTQYLYDTACFTVLILTLIFKAFAVTKFIEELISKVENQFIKTTNKTIQQDVEEAKWEYLPLRETLELNTLYDTLTALMIIMFTFRILFFLQQSPLIRFYMRTFSSILKNIFNLIIYLIVFILCYSLLIHVLAGQKILIISNLFETMIVALRFILKYGDGNLFQSFDPIYKVINIMFTFMIVNFGYVFLYSYIKETYYVEYLTYKEFKKNKVNKLLGDYFEFVKSSIMPNIYFLYTSYKKFKKEIPSDFSKDFKKLPLERYDDIMSEHKLINISYKKREVYFIYYEIKTL